MTWMIAKEPGKKAGGLQSLSFQAPYFGDSNLYATADDV